MVSRGALPRSPLTSVWAIASTAPGMDSRGGLSPTATEAFDWSCGSRIGKTEIVKVL
jgi:hypothetical protein